MLNLIVKASRPFSLQSDISTRIQDDDYEIDAASIEHLLFHNLPNETYAAVGSAFYRRAKEQQVEDMLHRIDNPDIAVALLHFVDGTRQVSPISVPNAAINRLRQVLEQAKQDAANSESPDQEPEYNGLDDYEPHNPDDDYHPGDDNGASK